MVRTKAARLAPTSPARKKAIRHAAEMLKQAADPTRLRVLTMLGEQERHVGALCAQLGMMSQPAVSHHLALLRHGGLIMARRYGKQSIYSLTEQGRDLCRVIAGVDGRR